MSLLVNRKVTVVNAGMADIVVSGDPAVVLASPGLGSCIGLSAYDSKAKVAGLVHIVLPDSTKGRNTAQPGKFADTAVPELIKQMNARGARTSNIIFKAAGGAQMFSGGGNNASALFNVGERNFLAVKEALKSLGLALSKHEVGGNEGRTIRIFCSDGTVTVKRVNKSEVVL